MAFRRQWGRKRSVDPHHESTAIMRGTAWSLALVALIAIVANADVAEAGPFDNLFKEITQQVSNIMAQQVKKFSVLSGVFGQGVTRSDMKLGDIINGAFSRNNSIALSNATSVDMDWKLGDGSSVMAGVISSGGSGSVAATFGGGIASTSDGKGKDKDDKDDAPVGDHLTSAIGDLLKDWDGFMGSDIWAAQDNRNENGNSEESEKGSDVKDEPLTPRTNRVVNGIFFGNAAVSGAEFIVKFFYNNEENFYCSGSFIGYPYVVTAAHCGIVEGDQVRVGGRLLRSGYRAKVAEVINHPDFKRGSLVNDVAIVRLDDLPEKDTLNENGVVAARINKDEDFPKNGFQGALSGHGAVSEDGAGISDELQTTRQTSHDTDKCLEEITQGDMKHDDSYLCAGDGERSTTCRGDSGAGLWRYVDREKKNKKGRVSYYEVYAVVSFGEVTDEALCPRGPPTVYQRASKHYKWIREVVGVKNLAW